MTSVDSQLTRAGDTLQQAWRADLGRRRRARPKLAATIAFAVLAVGAGVAAGSSLLKSPQEESASMIAGVTLFRGSDPTCATTSPTSYRCTLRSTPTGETFYHADGTLDTQAFLGVKMETVDATHHVDGGCVSVAADGLTWDCYVGQEAVERDIIGPQLLGAYSPGPAAG